jgi:predicted XRE-type DNA-binding protein
MTKKKIKYEVGSGNVFADLGLPDAEEHLIKAQLVYKIDTLMKERKLKQVEAAQLLGVKQPDISKMLHGDFRQFSVERLLRFLIALGAGHRDRHQTAAWSPAYRAASRRLKNAITRNGRCLRCTRLFSPRFRDRRCSVHR